MVCREVLLSKVSVLTWTISSDIPSSVYATQDVASTCSTSSGLVTTFRSREKCGKRPIVSDHALWWLVIEKHKATVYLLVEGESAPKCGRSYGMLDFHGFAFLSLLDVIVQAQLNCYPDGLTRKKHTLTRTSTARFSDGHQSKRLHCGKLVAIFFGVEKSGCFGEKVISSGTSICWVGSRIGLIGEPAAKRKHSVDKQRRTMPRVSASEIFQEVFFTQRSECRVLPAEIQCHQMFDKGSIICDKCPRMIMLILMLLLPKRTSQYSRLTFTSGKLRQTVRG